MKDWADSGKFVAEVVLLLLGISSIAWLVLRWLGVK
jgi:hypothetical protein